MCASCYGDSYVCLWLQADIRSPEIEVRLSPNRRHSASMSGGGLIWSDLGPWRRWRGPPKGLHAPLCVGRPGLDGPYRIKGEKGTRSRVDRDSLATACVPAKQTDHIEHDLVTPDRDSEGSERLLTLL